MAGYVKVSNTKENVLKILNSSDNSEKEKQGYFPLLEQRFEIIDKLAQGGKIEENPDGEIYKTKPLNYDGFVVNMNNAITNIDNLKAVNITPEMFGAKGDGITDDSAAIQNALNVGGKIIFNKNKEYVVSTTLKPKNNSFIADANIIFKSKKTKTNCFEIKNKSNIYFNNITIVSENIEDCVVIGEDFPNWNKCKSSNLVAFFISESNKIVMDGIYIENVSNILLMNNNSTGYSDDIIFKNVNAKGIVCSAISLQWVKRISFENLYLKWTDLAYPKVHALYFSRNCQNISVNNVDIIHSQYMSSILQCGNFTADNFNNEDDINITFQNCRVSGCTPITIRHKNAKINFDNCLFVHDSMITSTGTTTGESMISIYRDGENIELNFNACTFKKTESVESVHLIYHHSEGLFEKINFVNCVISNVITVLSEMKNNLQLFLQSCTVNFERRFITNYTNLTIVNSNILVDSCVLNQISGDGIISMGYDCGVNGIQIELKNCYINSQYTGVLFRNSYSNNIVRLMGCFIISKSTKLKSDYIDSLSCYLNNVMDGVNFLDCGSATELIE